MGRTKVRPLGHCIRCTRACWKGAADALRWNIEFAQGRPVGYLCPECQTPEENAEAEVNAATVDYVTMAPAADGRQMAAPVGGWHTVTALEHPLVLVDRGVHLALAVEAAELRVAVGPHSDARLYELFAEPCATVVRTALEREQARPGRRSITYSPMPGLGPDIVLFVEDHALCEDGEDRGELLFCFSTSPGPHLLAAFHPWVEEALRSVLRAA
ncbi:hypothetical protein [Streptomyces sp. NBC_01439]|uniref:hypothetical protein n=1 Tax=Streptomyces sp. NBC_01439 TaxID=2903867 RepID=UPI002E2A84AD|nr:hypothetical protein [Streptomyces sp. NBC_01439]